jgi:hypothetical protein
MASYPAAVWAPTTKNNGDTIQASHIDDVQAEIVAIEDGLLNGKAPLNSSHSTVATLSVAGGSTFAGAVVMSQTLTVNGETFGAAPPVVIATSSNALQLANNAWTSVTFETHEFISTSVFHSTAANPSQFVPPSSGLYQLTAHVQWAGVSSVGTRRMQFVIGSTTVIAMVSSPPMAAGTALNTQISAYYYFASATSSDFAELRVLQDSGSTGSLQPSTASPPQPRLSMVKIR